MLELYHSGLRGHSAIALICLAEKKIAYAGHFVDLLAFEQYEAPFLSINPNGQVPVLLHDGSPIDQTTSMAEYIEEAFPHPSLMPDGPLERWRVRVWSKVFNEDVAPSASLIAWQRWAAKLDAGERARLETAIKTIPIEERRALWTEALDEAALAPVIERSRHKLAVAIARSEAHLEKHDWLAGAQYSLADICMFPMLEEMSAVLPELLSPASAPRTFAWLGRMRERPAIRELKAGHAGQSPPDLSVPALTPGAEHVRWD